MIKNTELRKGNKIFVGPTVQTVQTIYGDDSIGTESYYIPDSTEDMAPNVANPIPLTEEWLLRMGFIDDSDGKGEACKKVTGWDKRNAWEFVIQYDPDYMEGGVGFVILQWQIGFKKEMSSAQAPMILKHVHQLQNLYFALTGEELQIKTT